MEISFIIPTYNTKVVLIKRCLESILNQESYNVKFEVIIVNDGSNDNDLLQYLESIKDLNNIFIFKKKFFNCAKETISQIIISIYKTNIFTFSTIHSKVSCA